MRSYQYLFLLLALISLLSVSSLTFAQDEEFSRQDKLRGSITPERQWWDLLHYHLKIEVDPEAKTIEGSNQVTFKVLNASDKMQIDLQEPLKISKVLFDAKELKFEREGNVYWITFSKALAKDSESSIEIHYGGTPVESKNPPWSGGFSWQKDKLGKPFIATSCQGIGASIWWPTKDHGYDEPDRGMNIDVTVPETLSAVSNGRLTKTSHNVAGKKKTFHWQVTQPINNYCINVNIGNYVNFSEKYQGEGGALDLDYWVLKHQRKLAAKQFKEVPRTIDAFEHWFGKYPFYEDSYKLVAVPYLGMEHQSSVTYGNGFQNGYRGTDLSATGVGMKFDFIIVHESGHEWFGNNISMKDAADMWIHESFTNYSENLFVEYHFSKKEGHDYVIGCRKRVGNRSPIIGTYNVNKSGSGDMYYKGGNMLHTLRHVINDDKKWRSILRGLNEEFWHKTVTTQEVESYIAKKAGVELKSFFDQYLRESNLPVLKYKVKEGKLEYWYADVVQGFDMPVVLEIDGKKVRVKPTQTSQTLEVDAPIKAVNLDRNFYVKFEKA